MKRIFTLLLVVMLIIPTFVVAEALLKDDNITYAAPVLIRVTFDSWASPTDSWASPTITQEELDEVSEAKSVLWGPIITFSPGHPMFMMVAYRVQRAGFAALTTRFLSQEQREHPYWLNLHDMNEEERLDEFERIKYEFELDEIKIVRQFHWLPGFYGIDVSGNRRVFTDVDGQNPFIRYLHFAYDEGIIFGDDDGNFRPNDMITEREAIAMLVRALGYSERAMELGGFPFGYIQVAEELGLFEYTIMNLDREREDLLHGNIIMLLYNALQYREARGM